MKYKYAVAVYRVPKGSTRDEDKHYMGVVSVDNTPKDIKNSGVIVTSVTSDTVKVMSKKQAQRYVEALAETGDDKYDIIGVPFKYHLPEGV